MLNDDIIITQNRAIARSYAKINLTLDVLGKLENGYHEVEMIMQTLSLFDLVLVDKVSRGISISTNLKYLPANDKNIAYKAAELFLKTHGIKAGVKIMIHKNIPVAAGLAGGSGNCAAVLCAMNLLFNTHMSHEELCRMGAKLGADVPFCIMGKTQLARGLGDELSQCAPVPKMTVLLVKPPINVSTASIYAQIDDAPIKKRPDTAAMLEAIKAQDIYAISENLCNVMEGVTEKIHPVIRGIKQKMVLNGALGALMSGSGPTVFGIFDDFDKAKASADSFAHQYKDVFLVKTLS
ncbi:MAG: 4-(cytidine 5'-diphospho)-2-C-methyl-D-erythritol kinase [Clostridiales bacterium]|nr:4-(cytidine 5'-diphospho)-2-C-methyl-D-erythritol kinase [Clostridiales bacterium]